LQNFWYRSDLGLLSDFGLLISGFEVGLRLSDHVQHSPHVTKGFQHAGHGVVFFFLVFEADVVGVMQFHEGF